jgi:superoxide dismutase, Fe-Mn family
MTLIIATEETAPNVPLDLPYAEDSRDPVISANTISFHYGKHDREYVATLQKLISDTKLADCPLERIVIETVGNTERVTVSNNAAQEWNHTFCWRTLRPNRGSERPANLGRRIEDSFGGVEACKKALAAAAATHLGSGWTCLVLEDDRLKVLNTKDTQTPSATGARPLLALELWQHPYYLDGQNHRADYVNAVLNNLIMLGVAADDLGAPIDVPERGEQS